MKKICFILIAIELFCQSLSAQGESVANKVFYSELGGPGFIMSANFDSRFTSNERLGLGYRLGVGFGYGRIQQTQWVGYYNYVTRTYYSIPAGLNYVLGKPDSAHTFEIGAGITFLTRKVSLYNYGAGEPGHMIGHLAFMYRIMPVNGGFSFRVGLTPIIGTTGDLFPMGAVGFGYAF